MEGDFIKINRWLLPLSWLYGSAVKLRNTLFEVGLLKSRAFKVPIISVGNITVGGTGKTPHVEYLVRLLQEQFRVAVLSRGYKRKSRGFVKATAATTMPEIGDEPYQMVQKFPKATVAVDKDRCHGIDMLTDSDAELDVVLLDDAFQHRYVKPGVNILLVDYHRLIIYDRLLPAGRLREPLKGKDRADIVIVTKCPKELKPMEYRVITKAMQLYPYQRLYFTTLEYGELRPAFPEEAEGAAAMPQHTEPSATEAGTAATKAGASATEAGAATGALTGRNVLLLTGIASPEQMEHDLAPQARSLTPLTFGDHHQFGKKDIRRINETFEAMEAPKVIVTTEKDATRLKDAPGLSDEVRRSLLVQPVRIVFLQEGEETFNQQIIGYVRKNSRNSILAKGKDDHKPNNSHRAGDRPRTISFRDN